MSINYRLGIGTATFRQPGETQAQGAPVSGRARGREICGGADVDPARVGIWGSRTADCSSRRLSRNSDVFVAGVDSGRAPLRHSLDRALSYQSSAASHVDTWKSPVYLVQGDDDRNVEFSQTIGLVQLLRPRGVYYELTVFPDDTHESLLHSRWMEVWNHSTDFLKRFVWDKQAPPAMSSLEKR